MIKNIVIGVLSLIILGMLFFTNKGCEKPETVQVQTDTVEKVLVEEKIVYEEVQNDSLNLYLEQLIASKKAIDSLESLPGNDVNMTNSGQETVINSSVEEFIVGFNEITKSKSAEEVLKHFLPNFTTNVVNIGADNKVMVERMTSQQYRKRLTDMLNIPGLKLELKDPVHLKTFVRENIAIALYMTEYDVYMKDEYAIKGFMLGQLTFKKYKENKWKIGNYSVVNIRDVDLMDEIFSN